MSSSEILIKNAIVLTMDDQVGDFDRADVLIRSGVIGRVAPDIGDVAGAEAVDASGCIVIPGLVDSHRHLWHTVLRNLLADVPLSRFFRAIGPLCAEFTPDDLYVSTLLGASLRRAGSPPPRGHHPRPARLFRQKRKSRLVGYGRARTRDDVRRAERRRVRARASARHTDLLAYRRHAQ